jgi:threonine dehydrogenase-like Zn-dependent dehydrogenase
MKPRPSILRPDKSIVFAGKIHGGKFGKTPTELLGGGSGAVIRFDATGAEVLSATRIGDSVDDMEVNKSNGQIAIIGDFGAALLWPDAAGVFWHKKLSPAGGFVLVVSPDFSKRLLWTTFEMDSYASTPKAIAAAAGAAVIASDAQKDAMVTLAAIQKEANNPSKDSPDAYLAVWNTDGQRW